MMSRLLYRDSWNWGLPWLYLSHLFALGGAFVGSGVVVFVEWMSVEWVLMGFELWGNPCVYRIGRRKGCGRFTWGW